MGDGSKQALMGEGIHLSVYAFTLLLPSEEQTDVELLITALSAKGEKDII